MNWFARLFAPKPHEHKFVAISSQPSTSEEVRGGIYSDPVRIKAPCTTILFRCEGCGMVSTGTLLGAWTMSEIKGISPDAAGAVEGLITQMTKEQA